MTDPQNTPEAPHNTPEVINLEKQDLTQFTTLEKKTTQDILVGTRLDVAEENEHDISEEFGKYINTLSENTEWASTVPQSKETKEINEQEKISNVLSMGAMLPIADVVEENFANNIKTTTENLTISSLLANPATNREKHPNIKKNLELLQTLKNIQNPPKGSIAYSVQNNWTAYAQTIQKYSENYLAQKNDFEWSSNTTGKTVAGATALQQIFQGKKSLPEALLTAAVTGILSATAHNYFDDEKNERSIKTATKETAGDFFTGTNDILHAGTQFLADYYKNPETSNTEKTVMTGAGIAGTLLAALKGGDLLRGIGNSAKNIFSKDKKNSDTKENSESFFANNWGKLGLAGGVIALILNFLPKDLGDKIKAWFDTLKDMTTPDRSTENLGVGGAMINSAEQAIDNTVRDNAEVSNTAGMEVKDYKFSKEDITSFKNIFTEFSHSENKPLADKAKEIIEEMKSEDATRAGITAYMMSFLHLNIGAEKDTYITSNRFGELAQLAQAAGYDVNTKENTDKTFSLTIKKGEKSYTINRLPKDVIEHNIAFVRSKEQTEQYRENTKIKFIQTGMDNLLAFLPTVRNKEDKNVKTVLDIAQEIKTAVDQKGSKGFTQELYQKLKNAITKINAKIISTKEDEEIILRMNEDSEIENFFMPDISLGIPPNISNEALHENKDLIQKNIAESMLEGFRQFENRVVIETLEAMINDKDIKKNSAVFQVLTKYRNRGDAFVNPSFFYEMYNAIKEDNDDTIAMAIDGAKFSFILGGKIITAGVSEDAAQLLKGIYNQDSDQISQAAGTAVFIGSVKLADKIFKTVPGMQAGRALTFIPAKLLTALYKLPVYTVKSLLNVNALTFQARHAKLISERKIEAMKNVSPAFRLSKKLDKFVRKIEILTAEKELYKGVVGKRKRVKEIKNILSSDTLKKEWEVLQKNLSSTIEANPKYFKNIRTKYSNITKGNVSSFSQFKDYKFEKVVNMIETNNPLIKNIQLRKTTNLKAAVKHSVAGVKKIPDVYTKIDNGIENQKNKFIENNVKSLTKKYSLSPTKAAQLSSFGGKLVNSVGVVATLSIMNNIADANNPYSEISKQAVTSSLFILGARLGSAGGIYGTIAGTAIAGMVTIFWGDKAGEEIETYFKEQETKADKTDKSAEYMNDADRISSIAHIADAGLGDIWDATAGSIFTGNNAYKYFSDTNKGFTHGFTYENYFHRGKEKVKYWNNEIAEKINDRKNTTKEYNAKFLSFDSSVQTKIIEKYSSTEHQTPQFIKNKIDKFRKVVRSRTDTKLSNTPEYIYLQWKNAEFKEKLLSDQIIEKDGKWIQQQAGELQTEYENLLTLNETLKSAGKKTSLKYLRALKAFIIHYRTLQNLELFNNAIDILSNSFPNDKHKGLKLTQNMLHFITELGNKENQKNLPEEIIELIGR